MPWVGGVQPVENEVQATGVTIGSVDRNVPDAARAQKPARFGIHPRSKIGSSTVRVPPSSPMKRTRDESDDMGNRLAALSEFGSDSMDYSALVVRAVSTGRDQT